MIDLYITKFCYRQKHNKQEVSSEKDWLFCMQKTKGAKKMYLCRRMRLCGFLLSIGFKYEKVVPDRYNPEFNCWLFKNTPELRNAVEEYYAATKK